MRIKNPHVCTLHIKGVERIEQYLCKRPVLGIHRLGNIGEPQAAGEFVLVAPSHSGVGKLVGRLCSLRLQETFLCLVADSPVVCQSGEDT